MHLASRSPREDGASTHDRPYAQFGHPSRPDRPGRCDRETAARLALADRDWPLAARHLDAAWAETAAGELPLVQWRLHAVEAVLHERQGDDVAATHARQAWAEAIDALIHTLPDDHKVCGTLRAAQPVLTA